MLRPKALDHIGIVVTDMDRSLRFYTDGLGLELLRRRGAGREAFAALKLGNAELNVFCNPEPAAGETRQKIDHLCLAVDGTSIDEVIEQLRDAGLSVAGGPFARSDGTSLFVHDPDGIRVELLVKH